MAETQTATTFNERMAHWTRQGLSGSALFEALATDDNLPAFFEDKDIAAIERVKLNAIKQRRYRNTGPSFIRMSWKSVKYSRPDYCRSLAARFVKAA
ncbi:MAG: hypothetical protein Q8M31_19175 [Beijerinckiaceae bacterium]|nr:hypothetical protein [Beijerinckiaceae bacterium]